MDIFKKNSTAIKYMIAIQFDLIILQHSYILLWARLGEYMLQIL